MAIPVTGSYTPPPNSGAVAAASKPASAASVKAAAPDAPNTAAVEVSVVVTLSVQAQAALSSPSPAATSPYARYFPTRDGKPANALANAVSNPGAVSSSAGKNFDEVSKDARARMDAQYSAMEAEGKPFDYNSSEGRDWYSLMGDLDRRSLQSVRSNTGGLFSKQEQDIAQTLMVQQQGLAMGLYHGPSREQGSFGDPFGGDHAAQMKAGVNFLDKVSAEEKTSIPWAASRAAAQTSYELIVSGRGETPEDLDSENPLAKLLKSAMSTMRNDPVRGLSMTRMETADDLSKEPWFKGFEKLLEPAMRATQAQYRSEQAAAP